MSKRDIPEPWMFATEVTVNGQPVQGQIGRFTLLGRLRMAYRRLLGRPEVRGVALPPCER